MKHPAAPAATPTLDELTPEQRALLVLRLRRKAQSEPEAEPLPRAPRDRPLPLSFGQRRLWLTDRWQPGNPAYNVAFAFGVAGRLDGAALDAAFDGIVRRHESLRTRFVEEAGEPFQVVEPPRPVPVPRIDLSGLAEEARLTETRRLAREEARLPFDLESGRLLRVLLLALGPDEHALLTVVHHIAADAWSVDIFGREFIALYRSCLAGSTLELAELPVQYPDFAVWQRERRAAELAAQTGFWRERLRGVPVLDLPTDRPRPVALSGRGLQTSRWWPSALVDRLQTFARRHGVTVFMTLLATFQTLLARHAGQDDVSVGTPVAGRGRAELEPLIGFFINTLVLRTDLSGDPAFRDLLARVREATLEAFAHQDVPFEQVVEAVRPGGEPLFQVMFNFQSRPEPSEALPGLVLSRLPLESGVSMFDLTLDCRQIGADLLVEAEHSTDLFDGPTVERLLGHLETLLAAAMAGPGRRISELPLLTAAERHAVLSEWNDAPEERADTGFVHLEIAEQARRTPDAPAVVFGEEGDGAWTYAELRRRAAGLARHLRALGVGPEVRVGICAGRTPERVASVLAVLEAGGAFVPLDPDDPRERLALILEDARPAVLLAESSEERLRVRLPEGTRFLSVEQDWGELGVVVPPPLGGWAVGSGGGQEGGFSPGLSPDNAAYILYTSGSTGRPKGVVVPHRGIASAARAWQEEYGLRQTIRSLLQVAGFSFDVFVGDLVRALTTGARLVLAPAAALADPALLHSWITRRRIDFADIVPAVARALVEHLEEVDATLDLAVLSVGADVWPVQDMERAARRVSPRTRLVNSYGVTEASVDSSLYDCPPVRPFAGPVVPIGRPFPGTRLLVLDAGLRPLPAGVTGELCLGGPNLARGYLGRPDLTAGRFVPNPFSEPYGEPGSRLYRTGDRARLLPDGVVELLGRFDHQIKVRGVRIEPGEIEAALTGHPAVAQAVAVAAGQGGDRRLVAFAVPLDPAAPPSAGELRAHLRQRLPEALVPGTFEVLDDLPLTSNGKLDRSALVARAAMLGDTGVPDSSAGPRTPVEVIVAGIFAEVLGEERVGAHEDFFELGGHSLLATQVVARLRTAFGVDLPLRRLFEAPTVADLAAEIETALGAGSAAGSPPLVAMPRTGRDLPLSFGQERLWFLEQLFPGGGVYHMPLVVRLAGPLDAAALAWSLAAAVERHEVLRTSYPAVGGRPVQRIEPAPETVLPRVDLGALPAPRREAAARVWVEEASVRPFELGAAPPWRALLLRLGPEDHVLALVLHHIAADGWSLEVLTRDLAALYAGTPPSPLPLQYADFAVWQRGWLQGEVLEGQLRYWREWRERLDGLPPALDLPFDRPRPAAPSGRGALRTFTLPGLAGPLRGLARRSGATLFMALLAGVDALLSRLSGQTDVAVGTVVAGREREETEGLVGLFVNTLVLRCDLADDPAFLPALLPRAREAALGAYAHQALPFERLVEELQPERSLSHTPLFQVMLALQNTPAAGLTLPGLGAELVQAERRAAAFELGIQLFEVGEDLEGAAEYATDLFDATTIERTLGHLATLLAGAMARPDARVSELPLLSAAERHQVEVEWSRTADAPGALLPVHQAFAAQARRTPDAIALAWPGGELTYGELDRRAELLARSLPPGRRVALLLERSPEFVITQLAVWKAGGTVVPLDPAWPRHRQERLREESGAGLVLAEALAPHPLAPSPTPSHLPGEGETAYVIFTSGSTGRPKGVVVEHGSLAFTLAAAQTVLSWDATDVTSWSSAPTFDISLLEVWGPLLAGGVCRLLPGGPGTDLAAWREMLPRLTRLHAVPGLMRALVDLVRDEALPCHRLRTVLVGGEAVPAELLADLRRTFPSADLCVLYGPTEATIIATAWRVPPGETPVRSLLGRPLPGVEIQVCDAAGRAVPAGVVGEIRIGGPGVARGYLDQVWEERVYRTGDRARWTAAGELEFRGRADDQVKVRGFRIEPGEIEAALLAAPGVREAAVAVHDLPGGRGLVAYVVLESPSPPDPLSHPLPPTGRGGSEKGSEGAPLSRRLGGGGRGDGGEGFLRAFLQDRLPASMVPAAFVILDRLPRTAHGKVDRRALPAPDLPPAGHVAPRTPLESMLAAMWREVIGAPGDSGEIGVHDNFFELGGDSIKGAIFTNRLGLLLGEHVPVTRIFESPTIAELAAALEGRSFNGGEGPELVRRDNAGEAPEPLSFAQERLWFLQQLDPEGATYNMAEALVLRGSLDVAALMAAWREILRRHETLRTRFTLLDGQPVAEVGPVPERFLASVDLERAPAEARRLAAEEAVRPFDLQQGPVARGLLLRLGPDEHLLLFTTHHIVCDAWSLGIWARELDALYTAFTRGLPPLPEPPIQYADFTAWQRSWLQGPRLAAQVGYWRERLRGAPPQLELPLDHPRPAFQTHRGAAASLSLPGELADRLRALSNRHGATLFMTLLAVFALHLGRLSGQEDVLIGSPIAGRTRPEVEGLIGCFLNTLVLRAGLAGDPAFHDLLRRVRETALGAFAHQDVPFEKVLEELRPERDTSRPPLFQVLFNLVNVPRGAMELPGLTLEPLGPGEHFAKFDLTLYVAEEDGLALDLVYNADLFESPRMAEILRQYRLLLEQVAERPDAPVGGYSLLTSEAAAVLPDPTAGLGHPWPGAVHDLFADQARKAPDRVALTDREGSWTYGELNRAVDGLAGRLRGDGIAPGDVVAVWAHRGAPLVWALLAIARAGAAFTILDPVYPAPRLIDRLRLAEPRILLQIDAAGPLPAELEAFIAAQGVVVPPPLGGRVVGSGGGQEGGFSSRPDDVACIAFTSGSTGLPKGIVQTHGSMSSFLPWHQETLGYTEADRHTLLSGLAHDPLQRDIFYCLATGATLCVPDPDRIGEPGYLAGWMAEQRVTVANLTPAMATLLTESPVSDLPGLRVAVLGGDLLTREVVERLRSLAPRSIFVNVYGTTESHRALSYHFVGEDHHLQKQTLPLGRGQTGCQLLVLTPSGGRAGIGELGEVVIRSPHLARGYLKDEARTREAFATNLFTGDPADRIYRTGDLGRYLPDGEVEAAGRADQQVKIRGFRVELGEIEAGLLRAPGVEEAVVVARPRGAESELVAYLAPETLEIPTLRERLRRSLPAYMVPAAWVVLPELPLNPNGKVDRLVLPAPEAEVERSAVPPRDELERRLARLWEEVLDTRPVGVTDDFFDLGGHSLLAVRLMARVETELGTALPLSALFQSGTVERLAARLRGRQPAIASPLVYLQPHGSRPPLFLVHPAGGQVLCYAELVRRLGRDQSVYGLEDTGTAERSVAGLAAAYLEEVLAVQPEGPYRLAGWSFGGRVAFEMARRLTEQGREVAFLGLIDTLRAEPEEGPDLSEAGLLREVLRGASREILDGLPPDLDDPLGAVLERMRAAGQLPKELDPESTRRFWQVFRQHVEMARRDRPRPWRGRLTFFVAAQDPADDPTHGWGSLAAAVDLHRIPGDHVSMIYDPANVEILARHLREAVHFTPS